MTHRNIGLVAHDRMKSELGAWAARNAERLAHCHIVATGTTAKVIAEHLPGQKITALRSGPFGGDQQLGAMIANGELDALIFFQDVMTAQPHDVDVKALIRLSVLYEIPIACNRASADMIVTSPLFADVEARTRYPGPQQQFANWANRKTE